MDIFRFAITNLVPQEFYQYDTHYDAKHSYRIVVYHY